MTFLYRILFYFIGLILLSLGVSLTIKADLGAGAWDALNVGLSETIGLTIGSWLIIVGFFLILVNSTLYKEKPNFLGVIPILIMGPLIDFWMLVVLDNMSVELLSTKIFLLAAGLVLIALGISVYLPPKLPANPIDNLMLAIHHRFRVKLMVAKTIGEISAFILALIFKGPIGIGTIFTTFLIGPFIQLFYPFFERLLESLTKETIRS